MENGDRNCGEIESTSRLSCNVRDLRYCRLKLDHDLRAGVKSTIVTSSYDSCKLTTLRCFARGRECNYRMLQVTILVN